MRPRTFVATNPFLRAHRQPGAQPSIRRTRPSLAWLSAAVPFFVACAVDCVPACSQTVASQGPVVTLRNVHPDANSTVDFDVKPVDSVSWASIANHTLANVNLNSGTYRAEVDRTSMKTDVATHQFGFLLFVNRPSLFQQSVFAYEVVENCTGVFNDTIRSVNLDIGVGQSKIEGNVSLPLHSPFGASNPFQSQYSNPNPPYSGLNPSPPPPQKLRTGSQTSFSVTATSNLNFMLAQLGTATASIDCGACLQPSIPVQLSTTSLAPNGSLTVTVSPAPNLWKAMSASRHPDSNKYDAILNVSIPFSAGEQGVSGVTSIATIPIEVTFSPPWPLTALSVAAGTLLGAFLRMWLAWYSDPKKTWQWREFGLGAAVALVCWVIAMFAAASGNLIIRLFGLTFDPTQVFAAFLLCLLLAGGPALLKQIEQYLPGGKS